MMEIERDHNSHRIQERNLEILKSLGILEIGKLREDGGWKNMTI